MRTHRQDHHGAPRHLGSTATEQISPVGNPRVSVVSYGDSSRRADSLRAFADEVVGLRTTHTVLLSDILDVLTGPSSRAPQAPTPAQNEVAPGPDNRQSPGHRSRIAVARHRLVTTVLGARAATALTPRSRRAVSTHVGGSWVWRWQP